MAAPSQLVGQVLGHYRIIEQIGAGGMGVVYRAHDEQLDRDVAIKVLPRGALADDTTRKRFRKEALSLARVNHPNIAIVHEFGSQDGADFLVTECIPGITLDSKLAAGALPEKQVIDLGIQLAQGLSAAHENDIVHRDLKPGNLRLTPDQRLKILDFGLAQLVPHGSELGLTATLTKSQEVSGTLPYMSPEQLRGEMADARTDIWAAGAVLYEMATAHRPFEEKVPTALAADIIHREPPPPRRLRSELSPKLEAVILKCLEKEPAKRYQSARELLSDLGRLSTGVTPLAARFGAQRVWLVWAMAGALTMLLGATAWYLAAHRRRPESVSFRDRRSVAVLGFKNLSGKEEVAWLSTALSEMLTTELAAGEKLRTVSGEDVARTKINLSLPDTDTLGKSTLARLHQNLGSDLVVLGSYLDLGKEAGGQIRLDLHLQDTTAGETLASISEIGTEDQIITLVSRSGEQLREKLGIGNVLAAESAQVKASLPSNPQATGLYAEGLSKLRQFEALQARDLLEKAVAADPQYAPAHAALAAAWSALGYDSRAQAEAKQAFALSASLSREERLAVEARLGETTRDWPKAIESYRTLWNFFPDNVDYGLLLAAVQVEAGKGADALQTVEALRRLPDASRNDPRIDLQEAKAAESLGDFPRERRVSADAATKAEAQGARLIVAEAKSAQGWALERLGELPAATAAFAEAHDLFTAAGDFRGAANATRLSGAALYDAGNFEGARKHFDDALVICRRIGDQGGVAMSLNNLGNILYDRGKLAEARSYYEQSLQINREAGSRSGEAGALGNLANVLDDMGDLAGALKMQNAGLEAFQEVGDKRGTASTLFNLGNLLAEMGDLSASRQKYQAALQLHEQTGHKRGKAYALLGLGSVALSEGNLAEARKALEESLALRKQMGDEVNSAVSQLTLAEISLEEGRPDEAEPLARAATSEFDQNKSTERGASAYALLARILLARGLTHDALAAAERSRDLAGRSAYKPSRFEASIASGRVWASAGKAPEAKRLLQTALSEAARFKYVPCSLEASLALGEAEIRSGQAVAGRARLQQLESDARNRGFGLIARKAAAAAKG